MVSSINLRFKCLCFNEDMQCTILHSCNILQFISPFKIELSLKFYNTSESCMIDVIIILSTDE